MHQSLMADTLDYSPKLIAIRRCPAALSGVWVPMDTSDITYYRRSSRDYLNDGRVRELDRELHRAFTHIAERQLSGIVALDDPAYLQLWGPWSACWVSVQYRMPTWAEKIARYATRQKARIIFADPDQGVAFPGRRINRERPWTFLFGDDVRAWWAAGHSVAWYQHADRKQDMIGRVKQFVQRNTQCISIWIFQRRNARIVVVPQAGDARLVKQWADNLPSDIVTQEWQL